MTPTTAANPDGGFTLLEVMIAATISMLALGAVTTAFLVGLTTTETTTARTAASHDAQMLSSYLPGDVLSVSPTGVDTGASTATGCNDAVASGEDGISSRNWLRLQWSQDVAGAVTNYSASYRTRPSPGGWVLVRYFCSGATLANETPTETIVARELADPSVTSPAVACTLSGVTVACGSGVERVSVTLTTGSGYSFSVAGARRTRTATTAVPVPAVTPDHFTLTIPAAATAGVPFSVTVAAKDAGGSTLTGYAGTVEFTSSDATATLPADTTFAASDNGVRAISGVTLRTAGAITITVKDTFTTPALGTGSVPVAAAAPARLLLTNTACSTGFVDVNNNGTFVSLVRVVDAYGNMATNSTGTAVVVTVTKTGIGGSVTPAALTIAASASETGGSFTATPPNGNKSIVVTAAAAGQAWASVECEVSS